jgi:transposase InsO family protein
MINKMLKSNTVIGLPSKIDIKQTSQCTNCPYGKQIHTLFKQVKDIPESIGDVIASDLCGPFELSVGGYRYFVTWIDLKIRYISTEFLKNKECKTVTESFKRYLTWLLRQKGANVKRVRTDNGGEYAGHEFQHLCGELGIAHKTTSPYTPEHNGIAERYNHTLQEGALTLIHDSGLSQKFWVSAIHTVNFVKNRLLHTRINTSPYEVFWETSRRSIGSGPMVLNAGSSFPRLSERRGTSDRLRVYSLDTMTTQRLIRYGFRTPT